MPGKIYQVRLTEAEQEQLHQYVNRGKVQARCLTRARILLLANNQWTDEQIAQALKVGMATVFRIRKRYSQEGLEVALKERPRSGGPPKVDSPLEAHLTLLACSEPPEGHSRWTLRLLADKVVELGWVDSLSHTTVRRWLKKTNLNPG
jgi:putative transposase